MIHRIQFLTVVLLVTVLSGITFADITSLATGKWNAPGTWVGGAVPGAGDNVIIAAGHTVTLDVTNAQCKDLTIMGSSAILQFAIDGTVTGITVYGNILINSGGRLRANTRSVAGAANSWVEHNLTIYGNLTNYGIFDMRNGAAASGTISVGLVTFAGTSNSVISFLSTTYQSGIEEFNGVNINKTGGAKVILSTGNVFMNNSSSVGPVVLTFISGIIETGSNIWVYLTTSNAGIVGASASSYVSGCLGRGMNSSAAGNKKFEIGDANGYRPVTIYNTTGSGSGHYVWAKIVNGNANTGSSTMSGGIDSVSKIRYYQVGYVQGSGGAATMGFNQFTPTYNYDDDIEEGVTGLMVGYSYDNRATWTNAGPTNHVTDLSNPPTPLQSSAISSPIIMSNGGLFYVSLAWGLGSVSGPVPDYSNVRYGSSPMNTFDFWKAPSANPTPLVIRIHGGGLTSGSKSDVSTSMITSCLAKGISYMSINYRLTPEVIIPQHYLDAARAIQYIRLHAAEYNINPALIGATGSSAGGLITHWLGYHNDLADPNNADSVLRMSTRLQAIANWSAQTTIDKRDALAWVGPMVLQFTTYFGGSVFGLTPDQMDTPGAYATFEMASPYNYVTADDPPTWMYYSYVDTPKTSSEAIHHINFGRHLKTRLDSFGITNTLLDTSYHSSITQSSVDFFVLHLITDPPLPVELTTFTASANGEKVDLKWTTATEVNNLGFNIERVQIVNQKQVGSWNKIGFVQGHVLSNSPKQYSFIDNSVLSGKKYSYRLKQIDADGSFKYSSVITVDINLPLIFDLKQNYPNPFNPSTSIHYSVINNGLVSLKVYDILGNEVAVLVNEVKESGNYSVDFNSINNKLCSGVYLYQLRSGNMISTKKMILIK
jgi:acetyl esterase